MKTKPIFDPHSFNYTPLVKAIEEKLKKLGLGRSLKFVSVGLYKEPSHHTFYFDPGRVLKNGEMRKIPSKHAPSISFCDHEKLKVSKGTLVKAVDILIGKLEKRHPKVRFDKRF